MLNETKTSKPAWIVLAVVIVAAVVAGLDFMNGWRKGRDYAEKVEREADAIKQRPTVATQPTTTQPSETSETPESPEEVIRQMMIASAKHDRAAFELQIVPNPDAQLLFNLWSAAQDEDLIELFRTLPIERLKVGDPLADPFTPGQKVEAEMIDANHLVLIMHTKGKDSWTHFVQRGSDGRWRVNMDWMIESIKQHPKEFQRAAPPPTPATGPT